MFSGYTNIRLISLGCLNTVWEGQLLKQEMQYRLILKATDAINFQVSI